MTTRLKGRRGYPAPGVTYDPDTCEFTVCVERTPELSVERTDYLANLHRAVADAILGDYPINPERRVLRLFHAAGSETRDGRAVVTAVARYWPAEWGDALNWLDERGGWVRAADAVYWLPLSDQINFFQRGAGMQAAIPLGHAELVWAGAPTEARPVGLCLTGVAADQVARCLELAGLMLAKAGAPVSEFEPCEIAADKVLARFKVVELQPA